MANNDLEGFDAQQTEPMSDFTALPEGDYSAVCIDTEWKKTKAGDGEYLQLDWEVLEGEGRGRKLFTRLNLKNKNATAVKIAQSELSSICRAVNVLRPKDSDELRNKPLSLSVIVEERNDKPGSFSNRIKGYAAIGSKPQQAPASVAKAALAEAHEVFGGPTKRPLDATSLATPPWRK